MNRMYYDVSGVSLSEFKFGLLFLICLIVLVCFLWLLVNIEYNVIKEFYFLILYCIKYFGDLKIVIVGVIVDGLMENEYFEME